MAEKLKKGKLYGERHGHLKKMIETIQRVYRGRSQSLVSSMVACRVENPYAN